MPVISGSMAPPLKSPKAAGLHDTVEGFMGALKMMPRGSPARGQLITSHLNHGPFLSALKLHPQGPQVHQMLNQFVNSRQNAGAEGPIKVTVASAAPHSYDWHDGHTSHHPQTQSIPSLKKANDQAAGVGSPDYHRFAAAYGKLTPGQPSNLNHYPYQGKLAEIEKLVHSHGYTPYYAGGRYGKPDLEHKNYNTGHLMIYDPTPQSGGDFGDEEYTKGWRQIHELAHALTLPELNSIYGEGRRIGKLGQHRTLHEAQRALHWEHLATQKQRELSHSIGVRISDPDFHREQNTVMHDALHRAVTGKFSEPGAEGFNPHPHQVPLSHAMDTLRDEASKMGLQGAHDTLKKVPMQKSERSSKIYQCDDCGTKTAITTNHQQQVHHRCSNCSWKGGKYHPGDKPHNYVQDADVKGPTESVAGGGQSTPARSGHLKVVKSEPVIYSGSQRSMPVAEKEDKVFSDSDAASIALAYTQKRVQELAKSLADLRDRELQKRVVPNHNHNPGITAGSGVEDVGASSVNPPGKNDPIKTEKAEKSSAAGWKEKMKQVPVSEHQKCSCGDFGPTVDGLCSDCHKAYDHSEKKTTKAEVSAEESSPGRGPHEETPAAEESSVVSKADETRTCAHCDKTVPANKGHSCPEQTKWLKDNKAATESDKKNGYLKKEELCKGCGKAHGLGKCMAKSEIKGVSWHDADIDQEPEQSPEVHGFKSHGKFGTPEGRECAHCGEGISHSNHGTPKTETKKAMLVDGKGRQKDTGIHPESVLPEDKKSKVIASPGSGGKVKAAKGVKELQKGALESVKKSSVGVPMAKPTSGKNMGTHVPTSKPKVANEMPVKANPALKSEPMGLGTAQGSGIDGVAKASLLPGVKAAVPGVPAVPAHADRAQAVAAQAPAAIPQAPVAAPRPGIFGRLQGKAKAAPVTPELPHKIKS